MGWRLKQDADEGRAGKKRLKERDGGWWTKAEGDMGGNGGGEQLDVLKTPHWLGSGGGGTLLLFGKSVLECVPLVSDVPGCNSVNSIISGWKPRSSLMNSVFLVNREVTPTVQSPHHHDGATFERHFFHFFTVPAQLVLDCLDRVSTSGRTWYSTWFPSCSSSLSYKDRRCRNAVQTHVPGEPPSQYTLLLCVVWLHPAGTCQPPHHPTPLP